MYSYSGNANIMINDKVDQIIRKRFGSFPSRPRNDLE